MTSPVTVLTEPECWDLLRDQELGRLAFRHGEGLQILPINYAVAGEHIVFRTADGTKFSDLMDDADVAFEVDSSSHELAESVVCRGVVVELHGEQALMTDQLRLRPWVATRKTHVMAIRVSEISGRRFHLTKPWEHMLPD
ncbi:MAG: pyridoxamine 5'-phosphate oxidase family protein [Actinomycetales bacterium]|nr:pyridoxamine 5'-phosphate oxidase family protein [Candidatus Phosphoribacter baldrii]